MPFLVGQPIPLGELALAHFDQCLARGEFLFGRAEHLPRVGFLGARLFVFGLNRRRVAEFGAQRGGLGGKFGLFHRIGIECLLPLVAPRLESGDRFLRFGRRNESRIQLCLAALQRCHGAHVGFKGLQLLVERRDSRR